MAFQTPFLFREYKTEWLQIFLYHDPLEKVTHVDFSTSQKSLVVVSNESWLLFEKHRFMAHIWVMYMRYAYIMKQNFTTIFLPANFFRIRLRKFSNINFFLKCVGVIFFCLHIRIQKKILNQMIFIDIGISTQRRFLSNRFVHAHAIWICTFWRSRNSTIVFRSFDYPKINQDRVLMVRKYSCIDDFLKNLENTLQFFLEKSPMSQSDFFMTIS